MEMISKADVVLALGTRPKTTEIHPRESKRLRARFEPFESLETFLK